MDEIRVIDLDMDLDLTPNERVSRMLAKGYLQGTSLLVDRGESALCGRQDRAASGVVSWRGQ